MSTTEVACIAVGILVQAATFALGLLVGACMQRRKEPKDGNSNG